MKHTAIVAISILLLAAPSMAIDLESQPVQESFRMNLTSPVLASNRMLASDDDEFDVGGEDGGVQEPAAAGPQRKSLRQALLYSFLLPGMGEYYVGNTKKARYFWAAEAVFWAGFVGFRVAADDKEDDYIRYAGEHAGIALDGMDEFTRKMVGFYTSTHDYNAAGRVSDRDRPYYDPNGQFSWQWQSESQRLAYRELRNDSDELKRRSNFMILGMVVNRVVSMIDAALDVRRANSRFNDVGESTYWGYEVSSDPFLGYENLQVSVFARF